MKQTRRIPQFGNLGELGGRRGPPTQAQTATIATLVRFIAIGMWGPVSRASVAGTGTGGQPARRAAVLSGRD